MKQSWVDSVDCSQRSWVRPCTWASRADSYCASVSHSGKATQLRGTLWLAGVIVMVICHLAHLRKFINYSIPHFFAQLSVLVQDRQIPEKVLFSDMFANTPFGSSFSSCDLCGKNHLGYFQWWLFSYTILSWSQQIKRITLKVGSKGVALSQWETLERFRQRGCCSKTWLGWKKSQSLHETCNCILQWSMLSRSPAFQLWPWWFCVYSFSCAPWFL